MSQGLLYYRHDSEEQASPTLRFLVPPVHRRKALDGCHRDAGHQGVKRTHALVEDRFWWPKIRSDVENLVASCTRCQRFRGGKKNKAELQPIEVSHPLELVHIDFTQFETTMDPKAQPSTANVLVIQDHFTRFMRAFVTEDQTAKTVAKYLYEGFIAIFGPPVRLHSDNGKGFTAQVIKELCKRFQVERSFTTPFHPMSNGLVERAHQTLGRMIGKLEPERKARWWHHLPELTQAFNATRSAVTGYSPYYLLFGKRPRLPIDFYFPVVQEKDHGRKKADRAVEAVRERVGALRDAYAAARQCSQEEASRQKRYYDRAAGVVSLTADDVVLVRNDAFRGKRKLLDRWGDVPHRVVGQVEGLPVYVVEGPAGDQRTLHRNRLFLVVRPSGSGEPVCLQKLMTSASETDRALPRHQVDVSERGPEIGSLDPAPSIIREQVITVPVSEQKAAIYFREALKSLGFVDNG